MIEVPIFLSHYGKEPSLSGNLHCFINNINSHFIHSTVLEDISINAQGLHKLGVLSLKFNSCASPVKYRICVEFRVQNITIKNSWDIWLFPNSKGGFKREIPSHLENQELYHNYDFLIEKSGGPDYTDEVYVTDKLTSSMIDYLGKGGRVLLLYRHPDVLPGNRDTQFLFPSTLDHFKPVIWDRGHNLGGIVRKHPLTDTFPHDGVIDFQFANLIEGGCKINLDTFPVRIDPIIQGIDRPVRDRMDVLIKGIRDFIPEYTMRRFGYLFEFKVGEGSLLVCTFNFKRIEMPEVGSFFREILRYMVSDKFKPEKMVDVELFKRYLLENAKKGLPEESVMVQFWQDDTLPVETTLFWMKAGIDFAKDWKG